MHLKHAIPDLLHVAQPVAAADEVVSGIIDPVMAAGGFIGQHEPALVAPALALDADLRAQAWLEVGDSIPARAEQRRGHDL